MMNPITMASANTRNFQRSIRWPPWVLDGGNSRSRIRRIGLPKKRYFPYTVSSGTFKSLASSLARSGLGLTSPSSQRLTFDSLVCIIRDNSA